MVFRLVEQELNNSKESIAVMKSVLLFLSTMILFLVNKQSYAFRMAFQCFFWNHCWAMANINESLGFSTEALS